MNTNMTGIRWFKDLCVFVLWMKVALALEGLILASAKKARLSGG